jgi:hypothetical protein
LEDALALVDGPVEVPERSGGKKNKQDLAPLLAKVISEKTKKIKK